jgi:hypothetical protein
MNYYIPDPQKWIHYYEQLTKKEYNPHMHNSNRKTTQKGGFLNNSTVGFMDPIRYDLKCSVRLTDSFTTEASRPWMSVI